MLEPPITKFHSAVDTPIAFQFQMFIPLPASVSAYSNLAGNSSFNPFGKEFIIDASVLENLRPSGVVEAIHWGLVHTYSHPIMKNGFPRS